MTSIILRNGSTFSKSRLTTSLTYLLKALRQSSSTNDLMQIELVLKDRACKDRFPYMNGNRSIITSLWQVRGGCLNLEPIREHAGFYVARFSSYDKVGPEGVVLHKDTMIRLGFSEDRHRLLSEPVAYDAKWGELPAILEENVIAYPIDATDFTEADIKARCERAAYSIFFRDTQNRAFFTAAGIPLLKCHVSRVKAEWYALRQSWDVTYDTFRIGTAKIPEKVIGVVEKEFPKSFDAKGNIRQLTNQRQGYDPTRFGHMGRNVHHSTLLFGVEYETAVKSAGKNMALLLQDLHVDNPGFFVGKYDGSLPENGVEIVTAPADYATQVKMWAWFFKKHGDKMALTSSAGMHIHVSKRAFQSIGHIVKFHNFIQKNKAQICHIAGRDSDRWSPYAAKSVYRVAGKRDFNKFDACNLLHANTLEIRAFRQPESYEEIVRNLQFLKSIYEYTAQSTFLFKGDRSLRFDCYLKWLKTKKGEYAQLDAFYFPEKSDKAA